MNEAARLLKQSGLQIAEIATAVGYNNTQHFNRVFKEFFEVSPKQYRG
jgi:transcriptional regulator GlxA family with amidase domain